VHFQAIDDSCGRLKSTLPADSDIVNIEEFSIYDLKSKVENKRTLDRSSMSEDSKESGQSLSQVSNYSITDLNNFINSELVSRVDFSLPYLFFAYN